MTHLPYNQNEDEMKYKKEAVVTQISVCVHVNINVTSNTVSFFGIFEEKSKELWK